MVGTHVEATSKSHHAGQRGTVLKDYGNYLVIKADDIKYSNAYKDSSSNDTIFQLDRRYAKKLKD